MADIAVITRVITSGPLSRGVIRPAVLRMVVGSRRAGPMDFQMVYVIATIFTVRKVAEYSLGVLLPGPFDLGIDLPDSGFHLHSSGPVIGVVGVAFTKEG